MSGHRDGRPSIRVRGRHRRPLRRRVRMVLAVACAGGALASLIPSSQAPAQGGAPTLAPSPPAQAPFPPPLPPPPGPSPTPVPPLPPPTLPPPPPEAGKPQDPRVAEGRELFVDGCASCHGLDARGIEGVAPTLHGVGAASADFYLSTGRMPLSSPDQEPSRSKPAYHPEQREALVAYVGSLGGPEIPRVDPASGVLEEGREKFTEHCAGCHQVAAEGGIVTGAVSPPLHEATPEQIAEAVRVGPHLMPKFSERQIDEKELNSIARYVEYVREPLDEGGWGIGHIGPIPEGMIAWLLAGAALILVIRLIGERTP